MLQPPEWPGKVEIIVPFIFTLFCIYLCDYGIYVVSVCFYMANIIIFSSLILIIDSLEFLAGG